MKRSTLRLIILMFFFTAASCTGQVTSFFQGQFNGGVTGCGYGPDNFSSGTGILTLNIPAGSSIYRAWLFAGRQGPSASVTVDLSGTPLTFNAGNLVSAPFQSANYGGPSAVHAIDVTSVVTPGTNTYALTIPTQSNTSNRFQDFYLYVAYTSSTLPQVTSCIFLNSTDFAPTVNDVFNMTYPIDNAQPVGMAMFTGYACSAADGENVWVNGTPLGNIYGPMSNSGDCAGPFGNFHYAANTLTGLLDGNEDQAMNGPDVVSDIKALVTPCATSVSATFTHGNYDNALWAFFFAYSSSPKGTLRDTTICGGASVQMRASVTGSTTWSPGTGLSCTACQNPIATPAVSTMYIGTTSTSCSGTLRDTVRITVQGQSDSTFTTSICAGSSILFGGRNISAAGTYRDTMVLPGGCTRILVMTLTLRPNSSGARSQSICQGSSYTFGGVARTIAGTYRDTVTSANGCDSVITLTLTVKPNSASARSQSICPGDSYTFAGTARTSAGTYRDTLTAANGCDSVITLTLTVKPDAASARSQSICPGDSYTFAGTALTVAGTYRDTLPSANGCDSVITLTLTVRPAPARALSQSICQGSSYTFAGLARTVAGTYRDTLTAANGCDSVVTLTLTVKPNSTHAISQSICQGDSYSFGGAALTAAGTYKDTVPSANGCDSVITLTLMVKPNSASARPQSICQGDSYTFGSRTLTAAGTYRDTVPSANGCDSVITLTLTLKPNSASARSQSICPGDSYTFGARTLTAAGSYKDTITSANGCDSIITLTLSVRPNAARAISQSICPSDSYTFGGTTLTAAGTYRDTLTSANGCDSVVTLTLSVKPNSTHAISQSICQGDSYSFGGATLTTAGTYINTVPAANGCDSMIVLTLAVRPNSSSAISQSICQGSSYIFAGTARTAAGSYSDTLASANGCDSVITLTLTVRPNSAFAISQSICQGSSYTFAGTARTVAGTYRDTLASANGCDSVITLTLTVKPNSTHAISQSICPGGSFTFAGTALTAAGVYRDTLTSVSGCDSVVTLTLSVIPFSASAISQSICPAGSYTFGGVVLTAAGTYRDTLTSVSGCDSVITLTLTVKPDATHAISQSICQGDSYAFGGTILTTAGTYINTVPAANGCDSMIVLTLSVRPHSSDAIAQSICQGSTYTFAGTALTAAGTYYDTLTSAIGCDSVVTLTLEVKPNAALAISQSICQGDSYTFAGTVLMASGVYTDTLPSANGCDSIVTLTLTVRPHSAASVAQRICQGSSYTFAGTALTVAGIYRDTTVSANGCDSITTLTLAVLPHSAAAVAHSICQGSYYAFGGVNLAAAGTYVDTITSANGCDSVITLTLTVLPHSSSAISRSICEGSSYSFGGALLTGAGTYRDTVPSARGCDSVITLTLTVQPRIYSHIGGTICGASPYVFQGRVLTGAGSYTDTLTAATGCDSVVVLTLTAQDPPVAAMLLAPAATAVKGTPLSLSDLSTGANAVIWQVNGVNTDPSSIILTDTGAYCMSLIAISGIGCYDTATDCIYVYDQNFYMPNAFSPNGDGNNDYIEIYGDRTGIRSIDVSIYNRWGELVFTSGDLYFRWDGTYKSERQEPGIFVFTLNVTYISGSTSKVKGSITLIR